MPAPQISDSLWSILDPLLPPPRPRPKGGRPPIPARAAPTGMPLVLHSGIPWEMLPREIGCGSGVTCWRRLRDWQAAGVWERSHRGLLRRLQDANRIDRSGPRWTGPPSRQKGGATTEPNPTDRGRPGTKRHLVTDRHGIPLMFALTGANVHDSVPFEQMLDAIPPIRGKRGRPRRRPRKRRADKAYDHRRRRRACRRRGVETGERLGRQRWIVERISARLDRFRRLTIRYERRIDIHIAFTSIACSLIAIRAREGRF